MKDKKKLAYPIARRLLAYAKVWRRDIIRNLTLAYEKRLFLDSNP